MNIFLVLIGLLMIIVGFVISAFLVSIVLAAYNIAQDEEKVKQLKKNNEYLKSKKGKR